MAAHNQRSSPSSHKQQAPRTKASSKDSRGKMGSQFLNQTGQLLVRQPGTHDVLSGRGGGINASPGNIQFRSWVSEQKEAYNLANSKEEKTAIAESIISLVLKKGGRFLQKTAEGWMGLTEQRQLAKTSQALREGGPKIRALADQEAVKKHQIPIPVRRRTARVPARTYREEVLSDEFEEDEETVVEIKRSQSVGEDSFAVAAAAVASNTPFTPSVHVENEAAYDGAASEISMDSDDDISAIEPPMKRVRVDYNGFVVRPADETPPLMPQRAPSIVPLDLDAPIEPAVMRGSLSRSNSLALSDISSSGEFVNPFEEESFFCPAPAPGINRESSTASDMGGLGALFMRRHSSSGNFLSLL